MHWKQHPPRGRKALSAVDKCAAIAARQRGREQAVALAVAEARAAGRPDPTAEAIAEKFDLPVGLLQWLLPRVISGHYDSDGPHQ